MKRILMMTAAAAMTGNLWAAPEKKIKTDDISNMIIQGENRLKVSVDVPETVFKPEVYREISLAMSDNSVTKRVESPAVEKPPVLLPNDSRSEKTASPWNASILEAPILTMMPKASTASVKMEWAFLVKDSKGQVFYERKGNGSVPERIDWNGFGSKSTPLQVGFDYSYSLSIIDEAGNPQRHNGKPFRVDAFRYRAGGSEVVSLSPEVLFADASAAGFSAEGRGRLAEVRDSLRNRYGAKIFVTAYDDDSKFAMSRSNAVRDYLIRSLDYPPEQVVSNAMPKSKGEGYRHVDITIK